MREFKFVWNNAKSLANSRKHGVKFDEAATVFKDPRLFARYDEKHSQDDDRYKALGISGSGRLLYLSFTSEDDTVRIISARRDTKSERVHYEQRRI